MDKWQIVCAKLLILCIVYLKTDRKWQGKVIINLV